MFPRTFEADKDAIPGIARQRETFSCDDPRLVTLCPSPAHPSFLPPSQTKKTSANGCYKVRDRSQDHDRINGPGASNFGTKRHVRNTATELDTNEVAMRYETLQDKARVHGKAKVRAGSQHTDRRGHTRVRTSIPSATKPVVSGKRGGAVREEEILQLLPAQPSALRRQRYSALGRAK